MPEPITYSQRYEILAGRVAYANFVRRQQAITEGKAINLQAYSPNNDASSVIFLREGESLTTAEELASYLTESQAYVPQAPLSLCVIPSNSALTILFIQGSDGGSAITNYAYSTDGVTFTPLSPAQTSSPLTVSGLTNGTVYTLYLKAINAIGLSAASAGIVAAPIPSAFTPASITGLTIWLDAQNSTNVLVTGGQVTAWSDSSSSGNTFTAGGGIITYAQPSGINNRPALDFTQANPITTYLSKTLTLSANQITLFMVVNQTGKGAGNSELFFTQNNYQYFDLFGNTNPGQSGNLALNARNSTQNDTGVDTITNSPIVLISVIVSTTETVYVNGSLTSVNAISTSGLSLNTSLTWAVSGGGFLGYIGEVIVYPSALVDTDRQRVEGYLAWKWGLQASLSTSNPYMTIPPDGSSAPGAPTLVFILAGNTVAYVYYTAGSGTVVNYQFTTNTGSTYTDVNPVDVLSPSSVSGLTNGTPVTLHFRAYNGGGVSSISNGLSVTPANPSLPPAWLFFDPNNSSCYSGSGSVNNIGTYGALAGTINGSISYTTGTGISRNVFTFTSGYIGFGQVDFGSTFTITAWIYPVVNASINGLLTNGSANVDTAGFKFAWNSWQTSNKRLLFETGDGTPGNWQVPNTVDNVVTSGVWQHVAVIFDRTNKVAMFLRNGIPSSVTSITTANNVSVNQPNFNIGAYLGGTYRMKAQLGLLSVFNTTLTAGQVLADFTATRAAFGV